MRRGARARGYRVVGWTKGVWDTALPGAEKIVERCVRGFRPGAILLLHDADGSGKGGDRGQTAEALPHVLSAANAMGYRLVPISELAELAAPRRLSALRIAAAGLVVVVLGEIALRKVDTSAVRAVDIAWWWVAASLIANFISAALKGVVWKFSLDAVPGPDEGALRASSSPRSGSASCSTRCWSRAWARSPASRCSTAACAWTATRCA